MQEIRLDVSIYKPNGMTFSEALDALKDGRRVQRVGWNGADLWLERQLPDQHSKMTLPYLYLCYPDDDPINPNARVPWTPTQTDMNAQDWQAIIVTRIGGEAGPLDSDGGMGEGVKFDPEAGVQVPAGHAVEVDFTKVSFVDSAGDDRTVNNVMRHAYRELNEGEKSQMKWIKDKTLAIHEYIDAIETMNDGRGGRELALARTNLEQACMWAVKAITG